MGWKQRTNNSTCFLSMFWTVQEDLNDNVSKGGLVCLDKFKRTITIRETKKANCKRGRINAERKRMLGDIAKGNTAPIPQFDGAAGEEDFASDSSHNLSTSLASDTSFEVPPK